MLTAKMKIEPRQARLLCIEFEKILDPLGWHVGLTGSCLYGSGGKDVDIIIYPHIDDDGNKSDLEPAQVLAKLGITNIKHIEEPDDEYLAAGWVDYIYKGKSIEGVSIDAFFLT